MLTMIQCNVISPDKALKRMVQGINGIIRHSNPHQVAKGLSVKLIRVMGEPDSGDGLYIVQLIRDGIVIAVAYTDLNV